MFAGKDLCENLFFKKTLTQVLSCDYFKIFNNSFFTRCNSNVNCDLEIMLGVYKSNITIMSFQRKRNKKFDVHVDLMFKLHLISNTFQISNFRFSLEQVAREDSYHNAKWNQSQCYVKQLVLKSCRLEVETTSKKPHGKLINISSILKVELTFSYPRRINVILSTWIRLS